MIVFLCLTAEDEVVVKEVTLALPSFVFRFFGVTEVPALVLIIVPVCVYVYVYVCVYLRFCVEVEELG